MWFLYLLSWIAMLVQICFLTIAVAAGLYYLAELVEEYTVLTKKIIWWLCVVVLCIYIGFFLFEGFPTSLIICGLISQIAHLCILQTFPYFAVFSPSFVTAVGLTEALTYCSSLAPKATVSNVLSIICVLAKPNKGYLFTVIVMLVVNHYLAFQYFSSVFYAFSEVLAYFTICLWIVPFALFVSLSANENILPTISESRLDDDVVSSYFSRKGQRSGLLQFFNYAKDSILPQRSKKAF